MPSRCAGPAEVAGLGDHDEVRQFPRLDAVRTAFTIHTRVDGFAGEFGGEGVDAIVGQDVVAERRASLQDFEDWIMGRPHVFPAL